MNNIEKLYNYLIKNIEAPSINFKKSAENNETHIDYFFKLDLFPTLKFQPIEVIFRDDDYYRDKNNHLIHSTFFKIIIYVPDDDYINNAWKKERLIDNESVIENVTKYQVNIIYDIKDISPYIVSINAYHFDEYGNCDNIRNLFHDIDPDDEYQDDRTKTLDIDDYEEDVENICECIYSNLKKSKILES